MRAPQLDALATRLTQFVQDFGTVLVNFRTREPDRTWRTGEAGKDVLHADRAKILVVH